MPIYVYQCGKCRHRFDYLQKISEPLLTVCPECGAPELKKCVTSASFHLKGKGWYATDYQKPTVESKTEGKKKGAASDQTDPAAEKITETAATAATSSESIKKEPSVKEEPKKQQKIEKDKK